MPTLNRPSDEDSPYLMTFAWYQEVMSLRYSQSEYFAGEYHYRRDTVEDMYNTFRAHATLIDKASPETMQQAKRRHRQALKDLMTALPDLYMDDLGQLYYLGGSRLQRLLSGLNISTGSNLPETKIADISNDRD